ncbi:hypothetical protein [Rubritalea squalenifaciens]|nr:hypothetical protein [Rubritalea squalenifaciens]
MPELPTDREHLRVLVIVHYIYAGLAGVGLLFLVGHYLMMRFVFSMAQSEAAAQGNLRAPDLSAVTSLFAVFYLIFGLIICGKMVLNILSARAMSQRKSRVLSLVTAGMNCLAMPLGTILGVFTFVVLCRDSVKTNSYREIR